MKRSNADLHMAGSGMPSGTTIANHGGPGSPCNTTGIPPRAEVVLPPRGESTSVSSSPHRVSNGDVQMGDSLLGLANDEKDRVQSSGHGKEKPKSPVAAGEETVQVLPSTHPGSAVGVHTPAKNSESPKQSREALNRELYRIPSYAGWFSWGKVHTLERRALSEFFDSKSISKTPKIYKEYRDFIINKFRENPRRLLTFTEVRKMLVGDVNCIRRVFDFLEYWGLINFHVPADVKQSSSPPATTLSETVPRNVRITNPGSGFARMGVHAVFSDKPSGGLQTESVVTHKDAFAPTAADADAGTEAAAIPDKLKKIICSVCGADCMDRWFECSKKEGLILCPNCFTPMNYGVDFLENDFTEKETDFDAQVKVDSWTQQESLRLLEAIMQYGEDWSRVANHVGTKSRAQCVIHFIQLPFGDAFLCNIDTEALDSPRGSQHFNISTGNKVCEHKGSSVGVDLLQQQNNGTTHIVQENPESTEDVAGPPWKRMCLSPHADASNPIMSQVAFLSAMVGPRVAAAAAQAAIAALAEEDPTASQILSSNNHNSQSSHKDLLPISGHQTVSGKESVKIEPGDKEDLQCSRGGQEQFQLSKELETDNGTGAPKDSVLSVTHIRAGIATGLAAAAANAKILADQEEREIEHLMANIIESQLKKLQAKVEHFDELEFLLEKENLQIEQSRAHVLVDRIQHTWHHFDSGHS